MDEKQYLDDLAGLYGGIGALMLEVKQLTDAVEQLHRTVRQLFDAQRQKDSD